ncbi:MAG: DUF2541 family protein [Rhodospirillaceae bacterium]|nr:DUF2541 family protein [Rhodospirillaceae bacterium]
MVPKSLVPAFLGFALGVAATAPAAAQQVDFLGSRMVADLSETDVIQADGAERYTAVRLCVAQRAVHFRDLDVFFANGGHQDSIVRLEIPAGDCTRWIDLRGGARNIDRIVMRYDTLVNMGVQAEVSAYGRR